MGEHDPGDTGHDRGRTVRHLRPFLFDGFFVLSLRIMLTRFPFRGTEAIA